MQDDAFVKALSALSPEESLKFWNVMANQPSLFLKLQEYFDGKYEAIKTGDAEAMAAVAAQGRQDVATLLKEIENKHGAQSA